MYHAAAGVLGSIAITLIYFYILKVPVIFTKLTKRKLVKPFSCTFCLSFWISLVYLILKTDLLSAIFISSCTPFVYLIIEDYLTEKFAL
jgi:hypothetical protein